ncbi:hypothetical protein HYX58_04720 [Candidatus Dependentiae bacterium]|nr:hypothetical protein [Candidatus Dependentiae bacterium]
MNTKILQLITIVLVLSGLNISISAMVEPLITRNEVLKEIENTVSSIQNVKLIKTKDEYNKAKSHYTWIAQYDKPSYNNGRLNKNINTLVNNSLPQVIVYGNPSSAALTKEVYEKLQKINGVQMSTGSVVDTQPKDSHLVGSVLTSDGKTARIYFVPVAKKTTAPIGQIPGIPPRK